MQTLYEHNIIILIKFPFHLSYAGPFFAFIIYFPFKTQLFIIQAVLLWLMKAFAQNLAYSLFLITTAMEVKLLILESSCSFIIFCNMFLLGKFYLMCFYGISR